MSMQTLTWDVDAAAVAAVAGNSDAYSLALATQARQKPQNFMKNTIFDAKNDKIQKIQCKKTIKTKQKPMKQNFWSCVNLIISKRMITVLKNSLEVKRLHLNILINTI